MSHPTEPGQPVALRGTNGAKIEVRQSEDNPGRYVFRFTGPRRGVIGTMPTDRRWLRQWASAILAATTPEAPE
jgi:hypothetical protein